MAEVQLNAKIRKTLGKKVKILREKGILPACLYGYKLEPLSLEIDKKDFEKVYKQAGQSTMIELNIDPLPAKTKAKMVLIHDLARDPVTDEFIHVDFYQVKLDKSITAEVPLIFESEAPAVKEKEGVLVKNITSVEVEALPLDLPRDIKVDLSKLKAFEDRILIKDLVVSEKVEIKESPEEVVALVMPPRTKEELEALEEKPEEKVEEVEGVEKEGEEEAEGEEKPGEKEKPKERAEKKVEENKK